MWPAVIAAIPGIVQMFQGISQKSEGEKILAGLNRPKYEIPPEVFMQLSLAQNQFASGKMPGEETAYQRIDRSAADAVQSAREGGNALGYVSAIQANQSAAYQNLQTASAQYNDQARERYSSMLANVERFKSMQFQMNQFAPFLDSSREARNQVGAGEQNIFNGLNAISGLGAQLVANQQAANRDLNTLPAGTTTADVVGATTQQAGSTNQTAVTIADMMKKMAAQSNYYINSIYKML